MMCTGRWCSMRWVVVAVLVAGAGVAFYQLFHGSRQVTNQLIAEHVAKLVQSIEEIDKTCGIIGIVRDRTSIDFLTVKSFSGSEVGPLNLVHPDRWQGPYLERNLTMQGKAYELIRTKEGWYVVPGDGVKLTNGKVIGKDIVFDATSDIESFVNDAVGLEYNGKPLAQRVQLAKNSHSDIAAADTADSAGFDV